METKPEQRDSRLRVMGRPSQGRDKRIQAQVTPEIVAWLETQKQSGESVSDAIFRLLDGMRTSHE